MSFRAVTRYPEIPAKAGTRKRHFTGPRIECGVTRCASGVVRSVGTYRAAMRNPGRAGPWAAKMSTPGIGQDGAGDANTA